MTEVLVVGAGPAGAVTAIALARRGIPVLLVGPGLADDGYDVMLSGPARRGLAALGVESLLPARPLAAVELALGERPSPPVTDAGASVCERSALLKTLHRAAVESGAHLAEGMATGLSHDCDGWHAMIDGREVLARHVVRACGAWPRHPSRRLRPPDDHSQQSLREAGGSSSGMAFAARYGGAELGDRMLLALAPPGTIDDGSRLLCVWALPGPGAEITLGAAVMGTAPTPLPADVLDRVALWLAERDPRFRILTAAGPVNAGPLDAGYTQERMTKAGHLLVGDAAGLVNPFTGEGFSYAVHSGLLAADAIAARHTDPQAARLDYSRRLAASSVGYFETARHAARRYQLAWRMLAATADGDRPFFVMGRRAMLLPETAVGRERELPRFDHPFLLQCDEIELAAIRGEWPFLARMMLETTGTGRRKTRPALLFLAGLLAEGNEPPQGSATTAAAIELAIYGALAFLSQAPLPTADDRGVDWASATTVLAGDFLIAQAGRLAAEAGRDVSWSFAEWLAEITALRTAVLDRGLGATASDLFGSLFEFPARLGAVLGGASAATTSAMRAIGRGSGHAYLHAEEVLALRGERTRLDITLTALIRDRICGLSEILLTYPSARPAALDEALAACESAAKGVQEAALLLPIAAAREVIGDLIGGIAAPAGGSAIRQRSASGRLYALPRGWCNVNETEFRVLGPVEVLRKGKPLRVAGSTTLTLLTGLLLSPNRVVPIETLTAWAWPCELPAHPRAALHNGISRLRYLIGGGFVDTLSWGYQLRVDADHHDLLAFEQLRSSGRTAAAYGQLEVALADLDKAAELWRTPLLGNLESISLERDRLPDLTERYLGVIEERNDLRLRLGLQEPLLEELPELIRTHPFRERLIAQLMTALARAGRRVDALKAYEKLRIALDVELGIDPGAPLQLLRTKILRDELPCTETLAPSPHDWGRWASEGVADT